jgi:hypothetical protein
MPAFNFTQVLLGVSFLAVLVSYVLLKLQGVETGPLDEGLLLLGGAIAGAATGRQDG